MFMELEENIFLVSFSSSSNQRTLKNHTRPLLKAYFPARLPFPGLIGTTKKSKPVLRKLNPALKGSKFCWETSRNLQIGGGGELKEYLLRDLCVSGWLWPCGAAALLVPVRCFPGQRTGDTGVCVMTSYYCLRKRLMP